MKFLFVILVSSMVLIAGCIGQAPPRQPYTLLKDGSNCIEYIFKNDIRETIADVPVFRSSDLLKLVVISTEYNVLYESYPEDNPGFVLASFAFVNKLAIWNSNAVGRIVTFSQYNIGNETELILGGYYNRTGVDVLLLGPNTGANSTAVKFVEKTIVVQGTNTTELERAGERFALVALEYLVDNTQEENLYAQRCG